MPPVLIIDDACGLCQAWAAWVERRGGAVRVIGASSPQGQRWLRRVGRGTVAPACSLQVLVPRALVLVVDGRCHQGSSAVLHLFRHLRQPWPLLALGLALPAGLRDALYDGVARRRQTLSRWCDASVAPQG